ncbi:MAG: 50S ribosomal protein L1 [Candidatus Magasanikbacteria bacterium RIFCSPHIGHO2_01_FULL_50_8]|uniref:Large ribosomal subunit protein uL1 n=1 Tax=Candidatus Magasanikbacteria bacterium RIFCSPHIGHO2_01_FULL_50_8 TaxID=1798674 RepID=A0A1F6LRS6_9BACT|nr:MAG: 50S ribosomal protein L1 [Candidatus Magasanikbacteria bacterium RIFCSPHIGHO2_01_FULL_50_8]
MATGKTYKASASLVDSKKTYSLDEAIALLGKFPKRKFDETVELHMHLGIDAKKGDQQVRSTLVLAHSVGKPKRIIAFVGEGDAAAAKEAGADIVGSEDLIEEIVKSGKLDFDIAVSTPAMMQKLAKLAKTLGPKGLMPNPKTDTVSANVTKMIGELRRGKVAFKNDDTANVHIPVGKRSLTPEQLKENVGIALDAVKRVKPASSKGTYIQSAFLTGTMSPSIRISVG